MIRLAFIAVIVGGCALNDPAKSFYDHAESGSTWQLDLRLDVASPSSCAIPPSSRVASVPAGTTSPCEPGCTCKFALSYEASSDLTNSGEVYDSYDQDCTGQAPVHFECGGYHVESPGEGGGGGTCFGAGCILDMTVTRLD